MKVQGRYRFIGKDKSLGYRKGQIYTLEITKPVGHYALGIGCHENPGGGCPYESEAAFERNWESVGQFDSASPSRGEDS